MSILSRKDREGNAARRSKADKEPEIPVFKFTAGEDAKMPADNNELLVQELGIRSSDSPAGKKLSDLVKLYEGAQYLEVVKDFQRWCILFSPNLGMIKLVIASHMRIWIANHRIPSSSEQKQMKMAFYVTAKANPIMDSYYEFLCTLVGTIKPNYPEKEVKATVKRYAGAVDPGGKSFDEFSDILGGWYKVFADPTLERIPDSDIALVESIGVKAPGCTDSTWMDELVAQFKVANYQTCIDAIKALVLEKRVMSPSMVRLCIASHVCLWYGYYQLPHPSIVVDLLRCYEILGASKSARSFISDAVSSISKYDEPDQVSGFVRQIMSCSE